MPPVCVLNSTVRQIVPSALGSTHASSVIPLGRSSEPGSGTATQSPEPSNESAEFVCPLLVQVAFAIVPTLPVPETSATVEPLPASKLYAATRPDESLAVRVAAGVEA